MSILRARDDRLIGSLIAVLFVVFGNAAEVGAQPARDATRGELLYSTHCIACHTTEVHWRAKKLATNWAGVQAQVGRWQGNLGLGWGDEDIVGVARYLNAAHYHFAAPE